MMSKNCWDCIHCDVCANIDGFSHHVSDVSKCKHFKGKADVEPVKRGEWKYIKSGEGVFDYYFKCSECHANTPNKAYPTNPDFCPHCGSKNVSLDCGICCVNYKDGKEVQE